MPRRLLFSPLVRAPGYELGTNSRACTRFHAGSIAGFLNPRRLGDRPEEVEHVREALGVREVVKRLLNQLVLEVVGVARAEPRINARLGEVISSEGVSYDGA